MEGVSVACRPIAEGRSERPSESSPMHRRRATGRLLRRLAVAVAPLVATVITAAPALAWPEMGG